MAAKFTAAIGASIFAVFIVLYSINSKRAGMATKDLGTWGGVKAGEWQATSEWQLAVAILGLFVACVALWLARSEKS